MPTHYEALGVGRDADADAIRRAYVTVAKANHPDRHQADDEARRRRADDRMRAANAAWRVLRDPGRRAEYDATLRDPGGPRARPAPRPAATGGPSAPLAGRAAPPSGIVVPATHASFWRYAPIAVVVAVVVALLVGSAYATSKDPARPAAGPARPAAPEVGDCVLRAVMANGPVPVPVGCGTQGSHRVVAVVDSPRPCPSGSDPLTLSDAKTQLCLTPAS